MIAIDDDLIQAYKETHYTVQDLEPFILRIGEVSEALMAFHKRHRVDCAMPSSLPGTPLACSSQPKRTNCATKP